MGFNSAFKGLNLSRITTRYNNMLSHAERQQILKILHPAPKSENNPIRVLLHWIPG